MREELPLLALGRDFRQTDLRLVELTLDG